MEQKSKAIAAIGWVWIAWSILNLIKALSNLSAVGATFSKLQLFASAPPPGFENTAGFMRPFIPYYPAIVLLAFLFFIICLISGTFFLRRKRWAYRSVEVLNLISILMCAAFVWFGVQFQAAIAADGMSLRHGLWGILAIAALGGAFIFLAFCLRAKQTVKAFARETHGANE